MLRAALALMMVGMAHGQSECRTDRESDDVAQL